MSAPLSHSGDLLGIMVVLGDGALWVMKVELSWIDQRLSLVCESSRCRTGLAPTEIGLVTTRTELLQEEGAEVRQPLVWASYAKLLPFLFLL